MVPLLLFLAASLVVKPYLQMGDNPSDATRMEVLWHSEDADATWGLEYRSTSEKSWKTATEWSERVGAPEPHRVYHAQLADLKPGEPFDYRVTLDGKAIFSARGMARKAAGQSHRVVIFGDCGQNTAGQRRVAYQVSKVKPDMVFIPGDIVYGRGRASEYRTNFFPEYNADEASPETGAPLIRSVLFTAAAGNHDTNQKDLAGMPDLMAYYYYWSQPSRVPVGAVAYPPKTANFSFDYGGVHWTVLDANTYVDWTSPAMRDWLKKDLAGAQKAAWRVVAFHQPGFNSSKAHFAEQYMRTISDLLEEGHVDVVFTGHVHNYQRSFPMTYAPATKRWSLDKEFDGVAKTKPKGIIYFVTGAGGAGLYDPDQMNHPETWQAFTDKFISNVHSFTQMDVSEKKLEIRQVSDTGVELDKLVVGR